MLLANLSEDLLDQRLVGFGGSRREGQSHFAEAELEQAIAAAGLTVIVAFRRCPSQDLDLTVVKSKATIDGRDLRLDGTVVGQQNTCRTALDDRWRNRRAIDIRER